ncbi:MAG: hypothetical protein ACKV2Q_28650 [Planctomycetaceae bacterium]
MRNENRIPDSGGTWTMTLLPSCETTVTSGSVVQRLVSAGGSGERVSPCNGHNGLRTAKPGHG